MVNTYSTFLKQEIEVRLAKVFKCPHLPKDIYCCLLKNMDIDDMTLKYMQHIKKRLREEIKPFQDNVITIKDARRILGSSFRVRKDRQMSLLNSMKEKGLIYYNKNKVIV